MCVIATIIALFGARFWLFFSWVFQWERFAPVFANTSMFWNVIGFLFVPWTLLAWAFMTPITEWYETALLIIFVLFDLSSLFDTVSS